MKRTIVYFNGQYVNLAGGKLVKDDQFMEVYNGEELIGIFDIAAVDVAYISEKKEE